MNSTKANEAVTQSYILAGSRSSNEESALSLAIFQDKNEREFSNICTASYHG